MINSQITKNGIMKTSGKNGYLKYSNNAVDATVDIVALNIAKNPINGWDLR